MFDTRRSIRRSERRPGLRIALHLPLDTTAPSSARRALDAFEPLIDSEAAESLRLVVSELVSNAVLHSGSGPSASVRLRVELADQQLRVEVVDEGASFSTNGRARPGTNHHGWGLLIVERLATRWGVEDHSTTTVWAEFERSSEDGG
jgi:anti-sigma regulatory factor (Ser/Thr protein kinase)